MPKNKKLYIRIIVIFTFLLLLLLTFQTLKPLNRQNTPIMQSQLKSATTPGQQFLNYQGYKIVANKIVKPDNKTHIIRGIDRPSLEWDANGVNLSLSDYQKMKSWNANTVRISLNQLFWRKDTNGYQSRIQKNIEWIKSAGMDVIIDLHWSDKGTDNKAAQQKMPDTNSILFWQDIARLYKDDEQIFFELYNEPHSVSCDIWKNGGMVDGWRAVGMQELYNSIRAEGARNIILIGGLDWAFDLTCVKTHRILGYNIAYTTHPYNLPGKNTVADWDKKVGFLASTDAIVITEFGNTKDKGITGSECDATFVRKVLTWAESKELSWSAWAWYPDTCAFPSLIKNWSGTPNANGRVVQEFLQKEH